MHDGRFKTLEQVVDFYSDSIKAHPNLSGFLREIIPGTVNPNNNTCDTCPPRKPHFTPTEKAALVAFLKTLTDTVITTDIRWSNPYLTPRIGYDNAYNNLSKGPAVLIKTVDMLGREIDPNSTGFRIEMYSDGSTKKIYRAGN